MAAQILIKAKENSSGKVIKFTLNEEGTTKRDGRSMTVLVNNSDYDYNTITAGTYPTKGTKIALVDLEGVRKSVQIMGVKNTPAPDFRSHTEFCVKANYNEGAVIYATVI